MKRREMKLLLEERFERITLLETRIDTLDQLVEGYRAREQAVLDAQQAAKENTAKLLEQAKAEADKVRAEAEQTRQSARSEAEALLAKAIQTANTLKTEAERNALEITAGVRADSERMLRDAQIIKREHEEMVDTFNAIVEQNASELESTAVRFAAFVKNHKIDHAEARLDGDAFYQSVGARDEAALPDASEDPALLMQNIYRIQNRHLPEEKKQTLSQGAQTEAKPESEAAPDAKSTTELKPEFPIEDGSGADARRAPEEPYSEAAWANEAQQSESEPQAEFTKAFDDAFTKSEFSIHDDGCGITQAETQSAVDEALAAPADAAEALPLSAGTQAAELPAEPMADAVRAFDAYYDETLSAPGKAIRSESAPEPYSAQAWAQSDAVSDHEPQAEGALFGAADEPADTAPRVEEKPEMGVSADARKAFDDYLTQADQLTQPAPQAAAPEPYSAQAWAQSDAVSDHEPQAEGALFSAADEPADTAPRVEEKPETGASADAERAFDDYLAQAGDDLPDAPEEPERAARRYDEFGEVRQWEPEPEPEMDDIPTVSRYAGQSSGGDDISLDDLLDEIIKAGE